MEHVSPNGHAIRYTNTCKHAREDKYIDSWLYHKV